MRSCWLSSELYGQKLLKQINDLKLDVNVAWIGEHLESYVLNHALDQSNNHPLLFFNWIPNILTSGKQFSHVHFPMCDDAMAESDEYADSSSDHASVNACDFQVHQLTKVMWSKLRTHTPEAHHVVSNLHFSSSDLNVLLESYVQMWKEANVVEGATQVDLLEQAACEWVRGNEYLWKDWLPQTLSNKQMIYLGGMFPLTGPYWRLPEVVPGKLVESSARNIATARFVWRHCVWTES